MKKNVLPYLLALALISGCCTYLQPEPATQPRPAANPKPVAATPPLPEPVQTKRLTTGAAATNYNVAVAWDAVNYPVTEYRVRHSASAGDYTNNPAAGATISSTTNWAAITGITLPRYIAVQAIQPNGIASPFSAPTTVLPVQPPPPPTNRVLTYFIDASTNLVKWTNVMALPSLTVTNPAKPPALFYRLSVHENMQ